MARTETFFHRLSRMFKPQRGDVGGKIVTTPVPSGAPIGQPQPESWDLPFEIDELPSTIDDIQIDGFEVPAVPTKNPIETKKTGTRSIAEQLADLDTGRLSRTAEDLQTKAEELRQLSTDLLSDDELASTELSVPAPSPANAMAATMKDGFTALTGLMASIQQNLENQNRRHDALIEHLAALPRALETLPKMGDILQQVANTNDTHQRVLDALQVRVEQFHQNNEMIAFNLSGVGAAIATVGRTSQASAEVLGQVHAAIAAKTTELHDVVKDQGRRFTRMLAVAIVLSMGALAVAGVIGGLVLMRLR
jgi:hypothetical protein